MNFSKLRLLSIPQQLLPRIFFVRTFKSDLKIKWMRPEKIASHKAEKSGDLTPLPPIDQKLFRLEYEQSKELQTADETVKKLFTLEYSPRYMSIWRYKYELMDTVKRHGFDYGSTESTIAKWTGCIRSRQELMERFPRNKKLKVLLNELIDKRKKLLKRLRKWDYKRFEWLIDKLDIVYKPVPLDIHRIERKDSLRKLTTKYCEDIKTQRLTEYKEHLEQEQLSFLEEKITTLEFIRKEQQDCKAEVTITEEEIEAVKEKLSKLKQERQKENA